MEVSSVPTGFAEATISIFAIVNPIGNIPVFMGLTEDYDPQERRHILRTAGVTATVLILAMAVIGRFLLRQIFHIDIEDFMFGGGTILMVVGIRNILGAGNSRPTNTDLTERKKSQLMVAVSPIGCPLLVGPGSIVTTMLVVDQNGMLFGLGATITAFALVLLVLNFAGSISRLIGSVGTLAIGRVMQIFIVAIGASFVVRGLRQLME